MHPLGLGGHKKHSASPQPPQVAAGRRQHPPLTTRGTPYVPTVGFDIHCIAPRQCATSPQSHRRSNSPGVPPLRASRRPIAGVMSSWPEDCLAHQDPEAPAGCRDRRTHRPPAENCPPAGAAPAEQGRPTRGGRQQAGAASRPTSGSRREPLVSVSPRRGRGSGGGVNETPSPRAQQPEAEARKTRRPGDRPRSPH